MTLLIISWILIYITQQVKTKLSYSHYIQQQKSGNRDRVKSQNHNQV